MYLFWASCCSFLAFGSCPFRGRQEKWLLHWSNGRWVTITNVRLLIEFYTTMDEHWTITLDILHWCRLQAWYFTVQQFPPCPRPKPGASQGQWRQLPSCPWSLPWCPWNCSNRNLLFPHRGVLYQGENALVPLPFQEWSIRPVLTIDFLALKMFKYNVKFSSYSMKIALKPCPALQDLYS